MSRTPAPLVVLVLLLALVAAVPASAQPSDTISIVKDGEEGLSNAEIASRLADETFLSADRVLIGRDDEFADAMSSGLLQADSPLLLVPSAGPVPPRVLDQLALYDPAEVLLLGGPAAIEEGVADELDAAGYAVRRAFGPSRFETATEIADLGAPDADTVLIARAFAADGGDDPTQAFADALAAGGWAAENGWPILLTQTEVLTGSTRRWLADRDIQTAYVLGGTAAVSDPVVDELEGLVGTVERVAGSDRFGTAIEIAGERGAPSAADVARVALVEGQGEDAWAGGFAAAAHSAAFDAPIVLASGDTLPQSTLDWLAGIAFAQAAQPEQPGVRLTCVVSPGVCEEARQALGLPAAVQLTANPPAGTPLTQGDAVVVTASDPSTPVQLAGTCGGPSQGIGSAALQVTATADCTVEATATLDGGATVQASFAYPVTGRPRQIVFTTDLRDSALTGQEGIWQVGVDGSDPRQVVACATCGSLRTSADGSLVTHLDGFGDRLVVRGGPDLGQVLLDVPVADPSTQSFADPQLTPDGTAVLATLRDTQAPVRVVRVPLGGGASTTLISSAVLAGPDAVGAVAGRPAALVIQIPQLFGAGAESTTFSQVSGTLSLIDATTPTSPDNPAVQLEGAGQAVASLSPDGTRFALSELGDQTITIGSTDPRSSGRVVADQPLQVGIPVWSGTATVIGVDISANRQTPDPRLVGIDAASGQVSAIAADARIAGDSRPGPAGQVALLGGGADLLLAQPGAAPQVLTSLAAGILDPQLR